MIMTVIMILYTTSQDAGSQHKWPEGQYLVVPSVRMRKARLGQDHSLGLEVVVRVHRSGCHVQKAHFCTWGGRLLQLSLQRLAPQARAALRRCLSKYRVSPEVHHPALEAGVRKDWVLRRGRQAMHTCQQSRAWEVRTST